MTGSCSYKIHQVITAEAQPGKGAKDNSLSMSSFFPPHPKQTSSSLHHTCMPILTLPTSSNVTPMQSNKTSTTLSGSEGSCTYLQPSHASNNGLFSSLCLSLNRTEKPNTKEVEDSVFQKMYREIHKERNSHNSKIRLDNVLLMCKVSRLAWRHNMKWYCRYYNYIVGDLIGTVIFAN